MIKLVFIFLFTFNSFKTFAASEGNRLQLSLQDMDIYSYTVSVCRSGTVGTALQLGFLPNIRDLKKSPGFWEAMAVCYGYEYGSLNYGNLMKQTIDMGQLTQGVIIALSFGTFMSSLIATRSTQILVQSQMLSRIAHSGLLFLTLMEARRTLVPLILPADPSLSKDEINEISLIQDARIAIEKIKFKALAKIREIDKQLTDSGLDPVVRNQLLLKREKIVDGLQKLEDAKS